MMGVIVFGESLTIRQICSIAVSILGIVAYSMLRIRLLEKERAEQRRLAMVKDPLLFEAENRTMTTSASSVPGTPQNILADGNSSYLLNISPVKSQSRKHGGLGYDAAL